MTVPPDDVLPWERPLGARPLPGGDGVAFRVWAPEAERVAVKVSRRGEHDLAPEGLGVWHGVVEAARPGDDYRYVLDGRRRLPDPCTRSQPRGLRGPSRVVDPAAFAWTDAAWRPPGLEDLVLYELHVGTFSAAGTFDGAIPYLGGLRELGVTAIELMPVAEFPGVRNWGYDGVYLSAAQSSYGGPEGLQRLVDAAHAAGLAVVLDVVYNHVGASGTRALEAFGPYFTAKYDTFWGKAVNYDDEGSGAVREWVLQSAEGWVRDFHLDGLRLDALHAVFDQSAHPILRVLGERVRAANPRALVVAESGLNDPMVTRPAAEGGWGHDAQWSDDFHHALRVLLTGEREGYYADFDGLADLAKAFHRPFVHDGGYSPYRGRRFGARAEDRPPAQFVVFCQNHDQVGNRALGDRLPPEARPLAAFCTLLSPFTPMLFMGEEYGEPAPFQFFTDHIDKRIAKATREGRRREFARFAAFSGEEVPDPQDPATFARSRLTREGDPALQRLYADLLRARRALPRGREADAVHADAERGVLTVRRGEHTLVCNFAREPRPLPPHEEVVLATHDGTTDGRLPPLAGALLR